MKRLMVPALAALISAAAVASISLAGTTSPNKSAQSAPAKPSGPPPTMAEFLAKAQKAHDAQLARIAKRLDISGDTLGNAIDDVMKDQLDAAVKANRLTDAQRDAILACKDAPLTCDRSNLPAPRFGPGFGPGFIGPGAGPSFNIMIGPGPVGGPRDFFAALAKKLGKDASDVRKAFAAERPKFPWHHGPGHHGKFEHGKFERGPRGMRVPGAMPAVPLPVPDAGVGA
jgi:hypothetical protein